ncbi:MAG TPA: hemolysin family protein, partial [Bacteroidales bacterium]|nr:hemolysin family protein [Bacteroidales bacterium]
QKGLVSGTIFSRFLNKPSELIATLLIGNNIALVLFSTASAAILEPWLMVLVPASKHSAVLLLILQTLSATTIVLVFGEFLPKVIFRVSPNGFLHFFAVPTLSFHFLFFPLARLFIGLSKGMIRLFFKNRMSDERYSISRIDLDNYLLELSTENDDTAALEDEIQMIQNAMDFRSVKLRDCMVPRTEVIAVGIDDPVEILQELHESSGHSKVMVYDDSIDHIVGYTHAFDLFKNPASVKDMLRPVLIVPESMLANRVMERFIKERKSVGVVVDEFGGTAGIITLEDVIEEIFGEIRDEFDTDDLFEKQVAENEYIFEARLEIHYLNETYGFELEESDEYNTLAGFILFHHEDIPAPGEVIMLENYQFTILEASGTRLIRVRMRLL